MSTTCGSDKLEADTFLARTTPRQRSSRDTSSTSSTPTSSTSRARRRTTRSASPTTPTRSSSSSRRARPTRTLRSASSAGRGSTRTDAGSSRTLTVASCSVSPSVYPMLTVSVLQLQSPVLQEVRGDEREREVACNVVLVVVVHGDWSMSATWNCRHLTRMENVEMRLMGLFQTHLLLLHSSSRHIHTSIKTMSAPVRSGVPPGPPPGGPTIPGPPPG